MCDISATACPALALVDPLLSADSSGLFRVQMPSKQHKTYIRDDGVVMVEIRPHEYVEESLAERLGLLR